MRALCILTVTLLAATAFAEPKTVPFEIVNVLPETQQVLVYDRARNTHVLLAPSSVLDDFTVVEITGIGVVVENNQERFTVYPRAARGLALNLHKSKTKRLPAIYSTTPRPPATTPPTAIASRVPAHR